MTEQDVETRLHAFRGAFERAAADAKAREGLGLLHEFPSGQCWKACHLTAQFLVEMCSIDPSEIQIVTDAWRNGHSHAWIEIGPRIVDLTDDQFEDVDYCRLVHRDRSWHDQFTGGEREEYKVFASDEVDYGIWIKTYKFIMNRYRPPSGA